jgi:hypothetical protein
MGLLFLLSAGIESKQIPLRFFSLRTEILLAKPVHPSLSIFPGQQSANVYCHNFTQDRTMHRQVCKMRQLGRAPTLRYYSYSFYLWLALRTCTHKHMQYFSYIMSHVYNCQCDCAFTYTNYPWPFHQLCTKECMYHFYHSTMFVAYANNY